MSHYNNFSHVASFEKLLGICNTIGARYNPGNASITPTALGALLEQAQQTSKAVTDAQSAYTLAVNARKEMFDALPTFISQLVRSATAHGISGESIRDLKLLKKKFYQETKSKKLPATDEGSQPSTSEERSKVSLYKTFDVRLSHFASIVSIIESLTTFKPNEPEMTIEGLKTRLATLQSSQSAVSKTANDLSLARIKRDESFFGATGIYFISKQVKEYVRSVTGVRSQTSLAMGKIKFNFKPI